MCTLEEDQDRDLEEFDISGVTVDAVKMLEYLRSAGNVVSEHIMELDGDDRNIRSKKNWRSHKWHAKLICRSIQNGAVEYEVYGFGDAPRKELARYAATYDLLQQLETSNIYTVFPKLRTPEVVRIGTKIYGKLEEVCRSKHTSEPNYNVCVSHNMDGHTVTVTCYVGTEVAGVGKSVYEESAHILAAFQAYEWVTKEKYELDGYVSGVGTWDENLYKPRVSEKMSVLHLQLPGMKPVAVAATQE